MNEVNIYASDWWKKMQCLKKQQQTRNLNTACCTYR